jgi:hypothetical protein
LPWAEPNRSRKVATASVLFAIDDLRTVERLKLAARRLMQPAYFASGSRGFDRQHTTLERRSLIPKTAIYRQRSAPLRLRPPAHAPWEAVTPQCSRDVSRLAAINGIFIDKTYNVTQRVDEFYIEVHFGKIDSECTFKMDHHHHHWQGIKSATQKQRISINEWLAVSSGSERVGNELSQILFFRAFHLVDPHEVCHELKSFAQCVSAAFIAKNVDAYNKRPDPGKSAKPA